MDKFTMDLLKVYILHSKLNPNDYLFKSPFNEKKPISRQRAFDIIKKIGELTRSKVRSTAAPSAS
jgi:hypothetical protein